MPNISSQCTTMQLVQKSFLLGWRAMCCKKKHCLHFHVRLNPFLLWKSILQNWSRPHRYVCIWRVSTSIALPFDIISTSVKRLKLTREELSKQPAWSQMALQDCSSASLGVCWLSDEIGWWTGQRQQAAAANPQKQHMPQGYAADSLVKGWARRGVKGDKTKANVQD